MRLLITLTHRGRGSCPRLWLLDKKSFLEYDNDPQELEDIWNDDKRLLQFVEGDEIVSIAVVEITVFDKWLIIFDGNSDASRDGEVGVVSREEDIDSYVKRHYMENRSHLFSPEEKEVEEDRSDEQSSTIVWNRDISDGPLDWTGKTTYECIADHYRSEFWGWADGQSGLEPNLIDVTDGEYGFGIMRFDLDRLNAYLKDGHSSS